MKLNGYYVCVVGHIHLDDQNEWIAGHAFIPGYDNWAMDTPEDAVQVIEGMKDKEGFPERRYRLPHPI